MSASARSLVYIAAMSHASRAHRDAVAFVEVVYVTLSAGIYAALQQRALRLRSRLLGNWIVVLAVPGLAQMLDWEIHRAVALLLRNAQLYRSVSLPLSPRSFICMSCAMEYSSPARDVLSLTISAAFPV